MGVSSVNCWWQSGSHTLSATWKLEGLRTDLKAFARLNEDKSLRKRRWSEQSLILHYLVRQTLNDDQDIIPGIPSLADDSTQEITPLVSSRGTVLQACTVGYYSSAEFSFLAPRRIANY